MGANQSRGTTKFSIDYDNTANYLSSRVSVRVNEDPHSSEPDEVEVYASENNRWHRGLARNNLGQSNTPSKLFSKNKSFNPKLKSDIEAKEDMNNQILNKDNQNSPNFETQGNEYLFLMNINIRNIMI